MPEAELILYDAHQPFPKFNKRFNTVIMTYFIHHFPIKKQIELIKECLRISDKVILGDVMTSTQNEMNWAQQKDSNLWDDEEFYIVVTDYQGLLEEYQLEFNPMSYCSGVLIISK